MAIDVAALASHRNDIKIYNNIKSLVLQRREEEKQSIFGMAK